MSDTPTVLVYVKTLVASLMGTTRLALAFLGYLIVPVILVFDFIASTALCNVMSAFFKVDVFRTRGVWLLRKKNKCLPNGTPSMRFPLLYQ